MKTTFRSTDEDNMKIIYHLHVHPFGWAVATFLLGSLVAVGQAPPRPPADAAVHFGQKLRDWDGFGVNYQQAVNIKDYNENRRRPQDYGGLSTLSERQRQEILDMVFGPDGLKPGLGKMFLDPLHEGMTEADKGNFDHETTAKWMNYFFAEGLRRTRARGGDLSIVTTMWCPPPWMTKSKVVSGRDMDPEQKEEVAKYMIDWVKFLRDHEKIPVKYVSLHNEGEGLNRWPVEGGAHRGGASADYNMYWPPSQVVDFLQFMRPMMDREGLQEVGLTPGETSNWAAFGSMGYAYALYADPIALKNMALVTSHGFVRPGSTNSLGVDLLRLRRPELHAWTTSMNSAPGGDNIWIDAVRRNIYDAKVNGIIPWCVVASDPWPGGVEDPDRNSWNSWVGAAIWVDGKGSYTVETGYYLFKHVFRAGQPGTAVAEVSSSDENIGLIAFARNGTQNPDALVINNLSDRNRDVAIRVTGTDARTFDAFLTDPARRLKYDPMGTVSLTDGALKCIVPGRSVITFFAKQ